MDLQLNGTRVLVTGGTRGIGAACVAAFLAEGAHVAMCARTAADVEAAVAAAPDGRLTGHVVDVSDRDAVTAWVDESAAALGGVDAVVANVSAIAAANDLESWRLSLGVDLMGTVSLVDAALPHLRRSGAGSIVTIGSVSGREVDAFAGPYGTVKAAIVHYTQGLAHQLAAEGIRANTVSPGNTYFEGGVWQSVEEDDPVFFAAALALNPTGRMATAEEIAAPVVFLSSPVASFVSGTNLVVDGALTRGVQL
ncbi:SDR family NAD(P)-dependent oxidoreductase [Kineococcus rubinsiae]|uniref:SDR family NAD(P)-dependent oxidoreductase n=1 Tax=Kineococcus rubinsiae TaxID=2609562 RepID=UPI001431E615|nr:SDR family oxidoreductase [Kineococcus rubinsiae]NIZ92665.1 SDR family oxidoreductase [Kineococcus rubinsiae]